MPCNKLWFQIPRCPEPGLKKWRPAILEKNTSFWDVRVGLDQICKENHLQPCYWYFHEFHVSLGFRQIMTATPRNIGSEIGLKEVVPEAPHCCNCKICKFLLNITHLVRSWWIIFWWKGSSSVVVQENAAKPKSMLTVDLFAFGHLFSVGSLVSCLRFPTAGKDWRKGRPQTASHQYDVTGLNILGTIGHGFFPEWQDSVSQDISSSGGENSGMWPAAMILKSQPWLAIKHPTWT